jgi:hypothetical protein
MWLREKGNARVCVVEGLLDRSVGYYKGELYRAMAHKPIIIYREAVICPRGEESRFLCVKGTLTHDTWHQWHAIFLGFCAGDGSTQQHQQH